MKVQVPVAKIIIETKEMSVPDFVVGLLEFQKLFNEGEFTVIQADNYAVFMSQDKVVGYSSIKEIEEEELDGENFLEFPRQNGKRSDLIKMHLEALHPKAMVVICGPSLGEPKLYYEE